MQSHFTPKIGFDTPFRLCDTLAQLGNRRFFDKALAPSLIKLSQYKEVVRMDSTRFSLGPVASPQDNIL